jgi:hypothetical protein
MGSLITSLRLARQNQSETGFKYLPILELNGERRSLCHSPRPRKVCFWLILTEAIKSDNSLAFGSLQLLRTAWAF